MDIWHSLGGMVTAKLTSGDLHRRMSRLSEAGFRLEQIRYENELTATFLVSRGQVRRLRRMVGSDTLHIGGRRGIYWLLRPLTKRKLLLGGVLIQLLLVLWLPSRVLFFSVEGNERVPIRMILEAAEDAGVGFGVSRREIRSEKLKNNLLSRIPELQWAGINTYGCRGVITVREREETLEQPEHVGVGSVVAVRDGYVVSATATRGSLQCRTGQAVQKGEVLISGYTDCGLSIAATRAEGEILALTSRDLKVITPEKRLRRGTPVEKFTRYSLILGKKRINFYKGSGILDATCVKMYSEYVLTLPGGFTLPVKLVRMTGTEYELAETSEEPEEHALADFAEAYLEDQMIAGEIRTREEDVVLDGGVYCLTGHYACREMIGRYREEEIGTAYGKTDRTDGER